jgi:acetyl-CoA carboxylase biotin carboxyl carrier protein
MDVKNIKLLLKLMKENELTEISIKNLDEYICLKKDSKQQNIVMPTNTKQNISDFQTNNAGSNESAQPEKKTVAANIVEIKSPMVGTFYRSPSPEAASFVETGQKIQAGTVLCILEAMKLMNEVKSEISGEIVEVLVENGSPIEFGQVLFLVKK